jgi:orotidine-5'-phosphate decarboxylase
MSPITVSLEVDSPEQATLVRQFHAYLQEMQQLALTAPEGRIIDVCEAAVLTKGQDVNRQVLQRVVQERIDALEKKGRRCGSVAAVGRARTAVRGSGRS